jgi:hypothetical protein
MVFRFFLGVNTFTSAKESLPCFKREKVGVLLKEYSHDCSSIG